MSATLTPLSEFDTGKTPYDSRIRNVLFCSFSRFDEISRAMQSRPIEERYRVIGRMYLNHWTCHIVDVHGRLLCYKLEPTDGEEYE